MRWASISIVLAAGLGFSGCASPPTVDDTLAPDDYPILPGRFAEQAVTQPLVAIESYIGDEHFYVKFDGPDGIVYAGGNWSERIDIAAVVDDDSGSYAGPYILPFQYVQSERWPSLPEKPIVPRLLSSERWLRFLNSLMASVLPQEGNSGIAMHFDNDDYFMFINSLGLLEVHLLTEKPAGYSVAESIGFEEYLRRGLPQLRAFLDEEGISDKRIVFSTSDMGAYSLPFLYVDLDLPIAVFVRYDEKRNEPGAGQGTPLSQATGHAIVSHTGGLATRPVSSLFRLLFVTGNAAVETVRPTWLVTLDQQPIPELWNGPSMNIDVWEKKLDRLTNRSASSGTITYLIDGEEYFTRFIDAVTSARESIHIRTYIFDSDDYAERIGRLLKRKSLDGVEVKVLLDGLGTILATGAQDDSMPVDFIPPASVRRFLESDSEVQVRQAKNPWFVGDHVKTTIIDNNIAFTGGMNIGREYRYTWHDMMMEVRGPVVDILRHEFSAAWAHAGALGDIGYLFHKLTPNHDLAENIGYPVRVLFTRPGDAEIFRAQLAAIRQARKYIYIENAYFTDDAMLYELAKARKRGVDVRIILPLHGNHGPINQSNILAANAMMEHGIRVFVYPGMSHIKAAIFDDWVCLGSANWDKLSFRANKELNIATSHPAAVEELQKRLFDEDFKVSVELTEPFPERWSDHLVEVLADFVL